MKYSGSTAFAATALWTTIFSVRKQAQNNTALDGPVVDVIFTTETTLILRSLTDYPLAGSIAEANPSSTVIAIECAGNNIDTAVYGTEPQTITFGSTTWIASDSEGNVAVTLGCSIAGYTESALCTGGLAGPRVLFTDPSLDSSDLSDLLTDTGVDITSPAFSATVSSTDFTFLASYLSPSQPANGC